MTDRVPMTAQTKARLEAELRRLKVEERPKISREIETARAHGDLSENAEYHAAKDRQGHVEARIRQIEDRLARAQVIDPGSQDPHSVRFGATVVVMDTESGEEVTYTIVGEEEADAAAGAISITSPVARALLGRGVEATVQVRVPRGTREFEILSIRYEYDGD